MALVMSCTDASHLEGSGLFFLSSSLELLCFHSDVLTVTNNGESTANESLQFD